MPLTIAHPAVAYPFRRALSHVNGLSALAIGSMTPDLPYFVRLGVTGGQSHSAAGLLWFCAPAGLALFGVYDALLRPMLTGLLPNAIRLRLRRRDDAGAMTDGRTLAATAGLVLAGAASHVCWDACTHGNGALVRLVPTLQATTTVFGIAMPRFSVSQYASTLVGLMVLAVWAAQWFIATEPQARGDEPGIPAWARVTIAAALVVPGVVVAISRLLPVLRHHTISFRILQNAFSAAAFAGGSVEIVAVILAALAWRALAGDLHAG